MNQEPPPSKLGEQGTSIENQSTSLTYDSSLPENDGSLESQEVAHTSGLRYQNLHNNESIEQDEGENTGMLSHPETHQSAEVQHSGDEIGAEEQRKTDSTKDTAEKDHDDHQIDATGQNTAGQRYTTAKLHSDHTETRAASAPNDATSSAASTSWSYPASSNGKTPVPMPVLPFMMSAMRSARPLPPRGGLPPSLLPQALFDPQAAVPFLPPLPLKPKRKPGRPPNRRKRTRDGGEPRPLRAIAPKRAMHDAPQSWGYRRGQVADSVRPGSVQLREFEHREPLEREGAAEEHFPEHEEGSVDHLVEMVKDQYQRAAPEARQSFLRWFAEEALQPVDRQWLLSCLQEPQAARTAQAAALREMALELAELLPAAQRRFLAKGPPEKAKEADDEAGLEAVPRVLWPKDERAAGLHRAYMETAKEHFPELCGFLGELCVGSRGRWRQPLLSAQDEAVLEVLFTVMAQSKGEAFVEDLRSVAPASSAQRKQDKARLRRLVELMATKGDIFPCRFAGCFALCASQAKREIHERVHGPGVSEANRRRSLSLHKRKAAEEDDHAADVHDAHMAELPGRMNNAAFSNGLPSAESTGEGDGPAYQERLEEEQVRYRQVNGKDNYQQIEPCSPDYCDETQKFHRTSDEQHEDETPIEIHQQDSRDGLENSAHCKDDEGKPEEETHDQPYTLL